MISFLCFKVIWMLQNFHFLRGINDIFKIAGRLIVTCTTFGRLIVTLSTFAKLISVLINKKHNVFSGPIPISVLTYTWLHSSVINLQMWIHGSTYINYFLSGESQSFWSKWAKNVLLKAADERFDGRSHLKRIKNIKCKLWNVNWNKKNKNQVLTMLLE